MLPAKLLPLLPLERLAPINHRVDVQVTQKRRQPTVALRLRIVGSDMDGLSHRESECKRESRANIKESREREHDAERASDSTTYQAASVGVREVRPGAMQREVVVQTAAARREDCVHWLPACARRCGGEARIDLLRQG